MPAHEGLGPNRLFFIQLYRWFPSVVPSQNFIRSRNLGHYRPKCRPKRDRNLNSLFGRENSLFFAENSLFTPKNFPACSTGRSNFVTAWLYQSSRAIGISHIRHDQTIGPDDTRQRIDGLNAVHVYLSKHSPRSETSLRTCGRRLLASPCPSRMLAFTPRECRFN